MFDTLEACAAAWEQAGNHGDIQTRIARNARWIPYYAFLADGREEANAAIDPHAAAVADGLVSRGYLGAGSTVLDIGSGTGAFAHTFASRGARVTALEMDASSLAVCRAQAQQLGLAIEDEVRAQLQVRVAVRVLPPGALPKSAYKTSLLAVRDLVGTPPLAP